MTNFYRYTCPIEQAIIAYQKITKRQPKILVVNPQRLKIATTVIQKIKMDIEIKTSGGCLMGEVWLKIPEEKSTNGGPTSPVQPALF